MKRMMSIAAIALFVTGASTFAGEECAKGKSKSECSAAGADKKSDSKQCGAKSDKKSCCAEKAAAKQ